MFKLPAHNANRWVTCTSAALMAASFPRPETSNESESKNEGLACHELVEKLWRGADPAELVGQMSSYGIVYDDDMFTASMLYINDINAVCRNTASNAFLEQTLSLDELLKGQKVKVDAYAMDGSRRNLTIWDFKYGRKFVDVFENWQLLLYAFALLSKFEIDGNHDQELTVTLKIVQPRTYHGDGAITEWVVKASDLRGYFNRIRGAAEHNINGTGQCVTGPYCIGCPAAHACDTLRRTGRIIVDHMQNYGGEVLEGVHLTHDYALLLEAQTKIKARIQAYETQIESTINTGKVVPGIEYKQGLGHLKWNDDTSVSDIKQLGEMFEIDVLKPQETRTPTQVRNLGVDESVIKAYAHQPPTKAKIKVIDSVKLENLLNPTEEATHE